MESPKNIQEKEMLITEKDTAPNTDVYGKSNEEMMRKVLHCISSKGECLLNNEVLENTPKRFLKAFYELTSGYFTDVKEMITSAIFDAEGYDDIVIVDDISFNSLCEHHLLPFTGKVTIGYLPDSKILGLSKFARLVEAFSKRLSLQERLTKEIACALDSNLLPKGVVVQIVAEHTCMGIRGVKCPGSKTKTIFTTGVFKTDESMLKRFTALKNIA
mmetsp:Transcript_35641/g.37034  ORF Transcript_35641/g.37034 Transcript_35641/m.37034 type:complete len:216 (-) Transcript_35641:74-721(-)|eukprot:CAMPEP_0170528222 /NCGR_PEP_ID=MMETSP0209-20121228/13714_1 /TAXON_ID=665100 ORGANISM="Litonotus pictus, Strain P1" /NCGR_SAMPLE_ID=MMETSP0209 /ASSEMBLY_ACC=CAM_ASM_000301 /LENGTH=215 /DNA_ID=CAMNT_0010819299 /DNA_START=49 /DNA_END=696 /DNA_ORIENTATION=-